MNEICPKCGLSKDLCVCETLAKEKEKIEIMDVKRRYGKIITVIKGVSKDVNNKKILKELKTKLACGGTIKGNVIELQGQHKEKARQILLKMGFTEDQVEVR
jgi:translation initiation factor 1